MASPVHFRRMTPPGPENGTSTCTLTRTRVAKSAAKSQSKRYRQRRPQTRAIDAAGSRFRRTPTSARHDLRRGSDCRRRTKDAHSLKLRAEVGNPPNESVAYRIIL